MRFEQLAVRIPGEELRMRFHNRVTVLSGLGALERQGLIDSLLQSLASGPAGSVELTYADSQGRRVTVSRDANGCTAHTYDDGTPAPSLVGALGLDLAGLRDLTVVGAAAVGLPANDMGMPEPPELREARAALADLNEQLESALAARATRDAVGAELAELEERIREADEGRAKRRFSRLLADLERVRAEAAAISTGAGGAASDRRLLEDGRVALMVADRWQGAVEALNDARACFGNRPRLDARTMAESRSMPERAPADIDALVHAVEQAESRRDALTARLSQQAASQLPEPSHPAVVRLAGADQDAVWSTAQQAIDTRLRLEQESLSLGGLATEGTSPDIATEVEDTHEAVEEAERALESRRRFGFLATCAATAVAAASLLFLPLASPVPIAVAVAVAVRAIVLPRRRLAGLRGREEDALIRAGVPTHLSFHMRRIDATIDTQARERLDVAALEHRVAMGQWQELAGHLDPIEALDLEDEVRAYAASVTATGGGADELDAIRRELSTEAEPAVERATADLMAACEPFGVDDASEARGTVRHQAETAAGARLQADLELAEHEEERLRAELVNLLEQVGIKDGDVVARVGALETALASAASREQARSRVRDEAVVQAELAELEARVQRESRPEWNGLVAPSDTEEPDLAELSTRREAVAQAHEAAGRLLPDADRLADRRDAVERRVAVLEAATEEMPAANTLVDTPDIEQLLVARVISARNAGPHAENLPVLLDEPFCRLRGEKKWEVLDLVERVSERTQVLYLTDDRDVVVWARRRAASGALALLEPVAEGAA